MPKYSVSLEKSIDRPLWMVDHRKIRENATQLLSPKDFEDAFKSQGHISESEKVISFKNQLERRVPESELPSFMQKASNRYSLNII
jgi:hypothetical protein